MTDVFGLADPITIDDQRNFYADGTWTGTATWYYSRQGLSQYEARRVCMTSHGYHASYSYKSDRVVVRRSRCCCQ